MRQINCYIPITLRITGRPSDAQLDQLGETLVRALQARIAFAEQTLNNDRPVSGEWLIEPAREHTDASRFYGANYEVPAYNRDGRRLRVPVRSATAEPQSDLPLLSDFHNYAFFFTGGDYGRAAEAFIREFYPEHHRYQVRSFEQMFRVLLQDIRRRSRRAGRRVRVSEIVIVTHANAAGGMKIPLTADRRRRTFSPWDLADLQQEFRRGLYQRFRRERREVVAALDEHTRIVVRGCNFGQSEDGLNALRAFFGGRPIVFAPTGYQGFEVLPIGRSFLKTPEQAFDFLVQQGYLPPDQIELAVEEKRRYIRNVFGEGIPAEFFLMSEADYQSFKRLSRQQRLGLEAEPLVRRPFEVEEPDIYAAIPSGGRFWNFSAPSALGRDPQLDALSAQELVTQAQRLRNPYRPQHAAMLLRLQAAWERKRLSMPISIDERDDPLGYLGESISIFGDPNSLALDANLYPAAPLPPSDIFEEETLPYRKPTPEQREEAQQFEEVERVFEEVAASGLPEIRESSFSARGRVETLPDGIRLWNFGVRSARLRPQFHAPLQEIAQRAIANPDLVIRVEGHTSSSGSPGTNERLSLARADTVRQFLIDAGVPDARIEIQGFGERNLLSPRERGRGGQIVPRNMARNRRVEVHLATQATRPTTPATPLPTEVELREIIQRFGPPPANRPEWIMWIFDVLTAGGHGKTVSWVLSKMTKVDIQFRLDVASFIQIGAWTIFAPLASYAEGQALGYANGAKRGFAEALNTMAGSVHDPPDGHIYYPSDEVPLDIVGWPYSEAAQNGYQYGVRTAIRMIKEMQEASLHGGEIYLLALWHTYYVYPDGIYPAVKEMLGGFQRRFRTPSPVDPILRLLGEEIE